MNKSAGKYVIEGTKKGFSFLFHHFTKFFVNWVFGIASVFSSVFFFLAPVFQKFNVSVCKMIDDSGEVIYSKAFDQSDHKNGYRSLLLFDILWFFVTFVGIALIMGFCYFINTVIISLNNYFDPSYGPYFANIETFTNYLYIPFGVVSLVLFVFSLMVLQSGTYVSYKNPELGVSDILFNAFSMMKERGGKLFCVNLLFFFEILTYAAVIVVPTILVTIMTEGDFFITWIMIPSFVAISIFVLPLLFLSYKMGIHKLMMDCCPCDKMILVYKKEENKEESADLIPLNPEKDENGETIFVELSNDRNSKKRKEK